MLMDSQNEQAVGQSTWTGGVNMLSPAADQVRWAKNCIFRNGYPETRPGVRRSWRTDAGGMMAGFYFNEDNGKLNDATHTGFWFPFEFVRSAWGTGSIQGIQVVRYPDAEEEILLFVAGGIVYEHHTGYVKIVTTVQEIAEDEVITFEQANNYVYMFRGEAKDELRWDFSEAGFVAIPAGITGSIPRANGALYHSGGRLWVPHDKHDIDASDIFDPTNYDQVFQRFSVSRGDSDEIMRVWEYHDGIILVFKRKRIAALSGVTSVVAEGTHFSDYIASTTVDAKFGLVARNAIVTVGEDVWYLGYNGINVLSRNVQGKVLREAVPMSAELQPLIDRINWEAVGCACACLHSNYVLFAVPIDGATSNNAILVYDLLAGSHVDIAGVSASGSWAGIWQAPTLCPVQFFTMKNEQRFMGTDWVVRTMFVDDPRDSQEPFADTPAYSAARTYKAGELVFDDTVAGDSIYRALKLTTGVTPPSDATAWEKVVDPEHLYDIETELVTRFIQVDAARSAMRMGRGEITFATQDPNITLQIEGEDLAAQNLLLADQTYSRTAYEIADVPDWDETNLNGDMNSPHREDYTVKVGDAGVYIWPDGWNVGVWEHHTHRFMQPVIFDRSWAVRIKSTRGMLKVMSVVVSVGTNRWAARKAV